MCSSDLTMRRSRSWLASLTLVAVLLPAAPTVAAAQVPAGAPILVLPFENPSQEARLTWMREGSAILLTEMLAAAGEQALDRDDRLQAFDRLQLPVNATLSRASTVKVGQAVAASLVVSGSIAMDGDQFVARARVIRIDTGRLDRKSTRLNSSH